MATQNTSTATTIYDELLEREYGALVLRMIVGRNMMRGVVIASVVAWSILGVWGGYEYIMKKIHERDAANAKVIYLDPSKLAPPPSLSEEVIQQLKITAPTIAAPTVVKPKAVEDKEVADTVQVMDIKEIARQIDASAAQNNVQAGEGTQVVVAPVEEDYIPKAEEFVAVEKEPEPLSCPPPAYPEMARTARVTGQVIVQFLVTKKGDVTQVKIIKANPQGLGFEEEATKAVKSWKFKPAINNGQPVNIWVTQPVRFMLK